MELDESSFEDGFDYLDLKHAQTIGIALGSVGIVAVIGDFGAVQNAMMVKMDKMSVNNFGQVQFMELIFEFAACNLHLKNNQTFYTLFETEGPKIVSSLDKDKPFYFDFIDYDPLILGELRRRFLLPRMLGHSLSDEEVETLVSGNGSLLFSDEKL